MRVHVIRVVYHTAGPSWVYTRDDRTLTVTPELESIARQHYPAARVEACCIA